MFERNQNNINPVRSVAAGWVLMERKTGSTTTQENKEKKVFFLFQACSTSRGKQVSKKNLISGSIQCNRWSAQTLSIRFPLHVANKYIVATVSSKTFPFFNIIITKSWKELWVNDFLTITVGCLGDSNFPKEYISRKYKVSEHLECKGLDLQK